MAEPKGASRAASYGIAAYPVSEGDVTGIQKRVPAAPPREPPNEPGRSEPWNPDGDNTAQGLLRSMHNGLLALPGRERARFLDGLTTYQQTVLDSLKSMRGGGLNAPQPADSYSADYEAPEARTDPQAAQAIFNQMGPQNGIQNVGDMQTALNQQTPTPMVQYARQPGHHQAPPMQGEGGAPSAAAGPPRMQTRSAVNANRGY